MNAWFCIHNTLFSHRARIWLAAALGSLCVVRVSFAQTQAQTIPVPLQVNAGTPLRIYLSHRVWYRADETVAAKVAEPVWAFDRIVIPAGAEVEGHVAELRPVSKTERVRAIVGGDFTPLKRAAVEFTIIRLPDGSTMPLKTDPAFGLATIYDPPRASKKATATPAPATGQVGHAVQAAKEQAHAQAAQLYSQARGLWAMVRGQNRTEWVEEFLLGKLPYHPQWYRARTRFDAVLSEPLTFGTAAIPTAEVTSLGTLPAPDAVAQMRLLTGITSGRSRKGDKMTGVISEPLFSPDHKLLFPQGTEITGRVTLAQRARFFHRGGKLRFAFDDVRIPHQAELAAESQPPADIPTRAQLSAAESDPNALAVDSEGTARATESKTRFLRPAVALLAAAKSSDNDTGRQGSAAGSNVGGRALGGFSGFGLLGIAASRGPKEVGMALGYYGLAWSVFSNVVSRGMEVKFEKNAAVAIRFGTQPRQASK